MREHSRSCRSPLTKLTNIDGSPYRPSPSLPPLGVNVRLSAEELELRDDGAASIQWLLALGKRLLQDAGPGWNFSSQIGFLAGFLCSWLKSGTLALHRFSFKVAAAAAAEAARRGHSLASHRSEGRNMKLRSVAVI